MSYLSADELAALRFQACGTNVQIDRTVQIYGAEQISIGNHVRIDAFCLLTAGGDGLSIGSHIHMGAGCYLFGSGGRLELQDFCGLSSRVSIYTATDDYSGGALTNPTLPDRFRNVTSGPVVLERHVIVGAGSVILPRVILQFGSAVGALTVVRKTVAAGQIVFGNPMQSLPQRRDISRLTALESEFFASQQFRDSE